MSKLAVITCHFNFNNFNNPINNLHQFMEKMTSDNVPVFGVELLLPNQMSQTLRYNNWVQISVDFNKNLFWQKECLLNIAEKLVPDEYDMIAWVDSDIIFDNPNWAEMTIIELQINDIVQLFEFAHWMNKEGIVFMEKPSIGSFQEKNHPKIEIWDKKPYHTGFAWAMTRTQWKKSNGLYPYCILGGGDNVMSHVFKNYGLNPNCRFNLGGNLIEFEKWNKLIDSPSVGFVKGNVYHAYHGDRDNRQYTSRNKFTRNMDIFKSIKVNDEGILEWYQEPDMLIFNYIKDYFNNRDEDN
jgi:hypothetical protein